MNGNEYSFFLFCKLFELFRGLDDMPYDEQFEFLNYKYSQYEASEFNDDQKPEYECMEDFLKQDSLT